jgi:protein-S-isoprenylcysteine O-methyltransferase Ste14
MNSHDLLSIARQLWRLFGPSPFGIVTDLWTLLCLYWIISALQRKGVTKREPLHGRLGHIVLVGFAAILLFDSRTHFGWLGTRLVPDPWSLVVAGVTLTAAGVALAIWARWRLGANWSSAVTIREQHELIGTGPYRWIRHPIYTGILLGLAGTALVVGEVRGLVGLAVAAAAFYRKARKEETWLNQEFGASFEAHAKQTGMFLPRFL